MERRRQLLVRLEDKLLEVRELMEELMIYKCSWCGKTLGQDDTPDTNGLDTSHGMCPDCEAEMGEELKREWSAFAREELDDA